LDLPKAIKKTSPKTDISIKIKSTILIFFFKTWNFKIFNYENDFINFGWGCIDFKI